MSGVKKLGGFFHPWVKKDSVIGEELSKMFDYERYYKTLDNHIGTSSVTIYAYDGEDDPDWLQDESGFVLPNFRHVCTLVADLSGLQKFMKAQHGREGQTFFKESYHIDVRFGGTAIKAKMTWNEGVSISHFHP